ncbi:MAG: dephospho-CoA kinase [Ignavibacteriales bacterium]|nr:dephospho-CoA kinase [Ignavibacteriales bacterium]
MSKKLKIAVTGGIGSGKSLVTTIIEKSGYPVIRSDEVAKELMRKDEAIKRKIIKEFGPPSYNEKGLNTKYLAENIFTHPQKVEKINSIVHPPTINKIEELTSQLFLKSKIVFVESALIYEANIQDWFDYVILIYADEATRIARVMKRETITQEDLRNRIGSQISDEQKKGAADFVIENNSTTAELEKRTLFILNILKAIAE